MKKTIKKTRIFEAAITMTLVLVLIIPGVTALTISEEPTNIGKDSAIYNWIMDVPEIIAHPGQPNVVIPINGLWSDELAGYCIGLEYDSSKIEIVAVTLEDTIADYLGSNWCPVFWSCDGEILTAGTWTFGTDFIPPGHGTLFNIIVNIDEDADENTWTHINFYEDEAAQPPIKCKYILPDSTGIHPEVLGDGGIFFIPPAMRSIYDEDAVI